MLPLRHASAAGHLCKAANRRSVHRVMENASRFPRVTVRDVKGLHLGIVQLRAMRVNRFRQGGSVPLLTALAKSASRELGTDLPSAKTGSHAGKGAVADLGTRIAAAPASSPRVRSSSHAKAPDPSSGKNGSRAVRTPAKAAVSFVRVPLQVERVSAKPYRGRTGDQRPAGKFPSRDGGQQRPPRKDWTPREDTRPSERKEWKPRRDDAGEGRREFRPRPAAGGKSFTKPSRGRASDQPPAGKLPPRDGGKRPPRKEWKPREDAGSFERKEWKPR